MDVKGFCERDLYKKLWGDIMRKKCMMAFMMVGVLGIAGCQNVTSEVTEETETAIVTIEENTEANNVTTCNIYGLEQESVDNQKILEDFIQDDREYEVTDYLKADEHNNVDPYEATGKQIKNTNWEKFHQCYKLGDGSIKVCEHTTLAEEILSIYDWNTSKIFPQQLWVYQTAVGMTLGNQISYSGFLKKEWKERELEFQTIDETKEEVKKFLKTYGVEVGDIMDVYGIQKEDLLENHRNTIGDKDEKIDTNYSKDGYFIYAYIQKDGITFLADANADENEDGTFRDIPRIELFYTERGVDYVRVENYQKCTEKIGSQNVIDYNTAKDAVLSQFKGVSYTGRERYVLDAGRLVYLPDMDGDRVITKPVWSFSGKKYDDEAGNGYYTNLIYMVDACTGKLIR